MRVFKEEQRFTQTWLIVLLIISTLVPVILIVKEFTKTNRTMSLNEFIGTISVIIVATSLIFFFKLKTKIDEKGIHYQFFPIHFSLKTISWSEIKNVHIRKYDAISEYGGWGYKKGVLWKKDSGTSINVAGDTGIQIELKNGKKILIGTQKKNDINHVIETYKNKLI